MSDIRSFVVAEVLGELAARPVLEDPLDAVGWLGDITASWRGTTRRPSTGSRAG